MRRETSSLIVGEEGHYLLKKKVNSLFLINTSAATQLSMTCALFTIIFKVSVYPWMPKIGKIEVKCLFIVIFVVWLTYTTLLDIIQPQNLVSVHLQNFHSFLHLLSATNKEKY